MRPLDPQRLQRSVMVFALCQAKAKVIEQIRAEGLKLASFSCREINEKRDSYFLANAEALIAKAAVDVWRLPEFAKHRPTEGQPQPNLSALVTHRPDARDRTLDWGCGPFVSN
jgi:hypothetical protein